MTSPAVSTLINRSQASIRKKDDGSSEESVGSTTVNWKVLMAMGLSILAYLFLGGLMFQLLEQGNESTDQEAIRAAVSHFLAENPSVNSNSLRILLAQVSKAFSSGFTLGENGTVTAPPSKWDYFGAVFFCITVVTTIGYGNLSPSTVAGRSVLCAYALIGIPMLTIFLGGISERVRAVQERVHRLSCWRGRGRLPVIVTALLYVLIGLVMFFIVPASIFIATEEWVFGDGMYYSFVTLSTIGFGDFVAGQSNSTTAVYRFCLAVWIFLGMIFVSGLIQAVQTMMETGSQKVQDTGEAALKVLEDGAAKIVKQENDLTQSNVSINKDEAKDVACSSEQEQQVTVADI